MREPPDAITTVTTLNLGDLHALRHLLADLPSGTDEAELIDQIDALERLKCAAAAAQARLTRGINRARPDSPARSVAGELGLARHESPHTARNLLTLAVALADMPCTAAALAAGDLSERRAQILVNETAELERSDRALLDEAVPHMFLGLGDRRLRDAVRDLVLQLDDSIAARRHTRAVTRRRVTVRAIGDGMSIMSAVLPSERVPGIIGSLEAEAKVVTDDGRTHSQRVLDLFMARLSGVPEGTPIPVATKVLVHAEHLFRRTGSAEVAGSGPLPVDDALALIISGAEHDQSSVQRIFVAPTTGALLATERKGRFHPKELAEIIRLRDRDTCRTPWCNAPVRHIDHVHPASKGGETSLANGEGLCVTCNLAKEAVGWRHRSDSSPGARHCVEIVTPTGHRHRSTEPGFPVPRVFPRPAVEVALSADFPRAG